MLAGILLVPSFDVEVDPFFERLAQPSVDHVRQPLSRQQVDLLLVRQVAHEVGVLPCLFQHAPDRDVFVLRAEDVKMLACFYS